MSLFFHFSWKVTKSTKRGYGGASVLRMKKKNREKINKTEEKINTPYTEEKFTLTFEVRPFCYLVIPGLTKRAVLDNQTDRALPSVF